MTQTSEVKCDRLFALYDADGDGYITRNDIDLLLRSLLGNAGLDADSPKGLAVSREFADVWEELAGLADADSDGRVTRDEYRAAMAGLPPEAARLHEAYRRALGAWFDVLDTDDDGSLPADWLAGMYAHGNIPAQDAAEAVRAMDTNGDGSIERDEFVAMWMDFFTNGDAEAPSSRLLGQLA